MLNLLSTVQFVLKGNTTLDLLFCSLPELASSTCHGIQRVVDTERLRPNCWVELYTAGVGPDW
jgi:hypothetical protein